MSHQDQRDSASPRILASFHEQQLHSRIAILHITLAHFRVWFHCLNNNLPYGSKYSLDNFSDMKISLLAKSLNQSFNVFVFTNSFGSMFMGNIPLKDKQYGKHKHYASAVVVKINITLRNINFKLLRIDFRTFREYYW